MHANETNDSQPADAAGVHPAAIDVHNHAMPLPLLDGSSAPACRKRGCAACQQHCRTTRNAEFAANGFVSDLTINPSGNMMVIGCVDPRVDPAHVLGLNNLLNVWAGVVDERGHDGRGAVEVG